MSKLQKIILYWSLTALVVILAVFVLVSINQKLNTATTANTVSFSGEGKVTAKPDMAVLYISVLAEAKTSKEAQNANAKKSDAVIDFLKKQGVEEKDIKTSSYNVAPNYYYPRVYQTVEQVEPQIYPPFPPVPDSTPRIIGYTVDHTLEVKIRNLEKAGDILDGVVTAGANRVSGPNFQIDEQEKLQVEARQKAIDDAKKKARDLEKQLGIKLGKIINFYESGDYPGPIFYEKALPVGAGGDAPTIPPGKNEIRVNVTITYQIK